MAKTDLPILEQRRIEASIIKPIYDGMTEQLGKSKAGEILGEAIIKDAIAQGQAYADSQDQPTSLASFYALLSQWTVGGALEIELVQKHEDYLAFNVTRCKYSEMYKDMELGEIGDLLSCNRDGSFCTGYNPSIKLERSQTIMKGASHCDFRFRWEPTE